MSEYQKIEDFRKGFLGQSNAKRYTISARLALRALPAALAELTRENARDQKLALFCCRSVLTTAVTGALNKPKLIESFLHGGLNYQAETLGVRLGRDISFEDAEKHDISSDYGSYTDSINVADLAFEAARNANGFPHSHMGGNMSAFYKYAIDDTLRDSAKEPGDVFSSLLWNNNGIPDRFSSDWLKFCAYVEKHNEWSFWRDWYQGFLEGKPLDWRVQEVIAQFPNHYWRIGARFVAELIEEVRMIPDDDWEKGPEWIEELVGRISLKCRTATAPRLVRGVDDSVFHVESEEALNDEVIEFACHRIESALKNALDTSGANGLREDSDETITIRRALDDHRGSASILATGFFDACLSFQRNIGDRYPNDAVLINLQNALYAVVEEINEQHEDARKRCARLAALTKPELISQQDRDEIALVPETIAPELDSEALGIIESDVEHILTQERPAKSVRARFTNWVTTVSLWMDKAMKGDKQARWLAGIVSRLVSWWSGTDQDEE